MEEPKPEHFGLTKEQCDYLKNNQDKTVRAIIVICIVLSIFIANYIVLGGFDNTNRTILGLIGGWILVGLIFGAPCGVLIGLIIVLIYMGIISNFSRSYRKLNQYKAAKNKYDSWWIRNQELFWMSLAGRRFEYELAFLYSKLGYKVEFPKRREPDKGIDFTLKKDEKTIIVQCKAHKNPVSPHVIRDLYGTMINSKADEAILASISGFTSGVKEYALGKPIDLVSLEDIIRMRKKISSD